MRELLSALEIRRPKHSRRPHMLMRCLVHLGAFCGLRYGEIMGLTRASVDLDGRVLHIRHSLTRWDQLKGPKTASGIRDVPLPRHVAEVLREWLSTYYVENERQLIFRHPNGEMIEHSAVHFLWKSLLRHAVLGDDFDRDHFHALRHFAASIMVDHLPLTDVASLLGHSKFDTTLQVYAHPIAGGHRRHAAFEQMAIAFIAGDATRA